MDHSEPATRAQTCTSIFRNGGGTVSKEQFTQVWIAMINQIEKNKSVKAPRPK